MTSYWVLFSRVIGTSPRLLVRLTLREATTWIPLRIADASPSTCWLNDTPSTLRSPRHAAEVAVTSVFFIGLMSCSWHLGPRLGGHSTGLRACTSSRTSSTAVR